MSPHSACFIFTVFRNGIRAQLQDSLNQVITVGFYPTWDELFPDFSYVLPDVRFKIRHHDAGFLPR